MKRTQPGFGYSAKTGFRNFPARQPSLADLRETEWHMIGHLQSNKAAAAAEVFTAVDSVDSLRLAEKLNAQPESWVRNWVCWSKSMWAAKRRRADWRPHSG